MIHRYRRGHSSPPWWIWAFPVSGLLMWVWAIVIVVTGESPF